MLVTDHALGPGEKSRAWVRRKEGKGGLHCCVFCYLCIVEKKKPWFLRDYKPLPRLFEITCVCIYLFVCLCFIFLLQAGRAGCKWQKAESQMKIAPLFTCNNSLSVNASWYLTFPFPSVKKQWDGGNFTATILVLKQKYTCKVFHLSRELWLFPCFYKNSWLQMWHQQR